MVLEIKRSGARPAVRDQRRAIGPPGRSTYNFAIRNNPIQQLVMIRDRNLFHKLFGKAETYSPGSAACRVSTAYSAQKSIVVAFASPQAAPLSVEG
jgi:hypothetical protein